MRSNLGEIELLEYAAMTTLPLIREIKSCNHPLKILIKHPDTIDGTQKQRTITTLDTIIKSIYQNDTNLQIRCYKLPYTLKARKIGNALLEMGWLTPDINNQTTYGHGNPSILFELSHNATAMYSAFFRKTFDDYWNHADTEDGADVLSRLSENTTTADNSSA
jgi:hypothetical protein